MIYLKQLLDFMLPVKWVMLVTYDGGNNRLSGAVAGGRYGRPMVEPGATSLPPLHSLLLRWKLSPTSAPPADCGWDPSSPSGPSSTWARGITRHTTLSSITCPFSSEDDLGDLDVTVTTRPEQSEPMQMPGGLTLPSSVLKQTLQAGPTLYRSRQSS